MKLNALEKALMNNPVRAWVQWRVEAPLLESLGGRLEGMRALEVGCGRGVGTQIILDHFGAQEVWAFDIDERMVELARWRLSAYPAARWRLSVGDATSITAEDASFDAVFDFGILHHIPDLHRAVSEIRRVLRPGGRFFFMEVTSQALSRRSYRHLFAHPASNRFGRAEFTAELKRLGINVGGRIVERFFGDFIYGVGKVEMMETSMSVARSNSTVGIEGL